MLGICLGGFDVSPPNNHDPRVESLCRDMEKLYEDVYYGRGKDNPPMTARMEKVESAVATTTYYARWFLGLLGLVLVAIVADMATRHH